MNILFVCLGNICRSPMAEAIFNFKIQRICDRASCVADSCGLSDYHIGGSPDERTVRVLQKKGITIHHKARQIQSDDLIHFDLVLVMDKSNYRSILRMSDANLNKDKIFLIRHFEANALDKEVPDPYYGDETDFQKVFDMLSRSIDGLIEYLGKRYAFRRLKE